MVDCCVEGNEGGERIREEPGQVQEPKLMGGFLGKVGGRVNRGGFWSI